MSWSRFSTKDSWYIYPCIYGYISATPIGGPEIRWNPDESFGDFIVKAIHVLKDAYKDEDDDEIRRKLKVMLDVLMANHDDVMQCMDEFREEHKKKETGDGTGHVAVQD